MLTAALLSATWALAASHSQTTPPADAAEQLKSADSLCSQKKYAEAEASYRQILVASPDFLLAADALGNCYLSMGRPMDAGRIFNEVLRRDPKNRPAQQSMARVLVELNRFAPAESLLKNLVASDNNDKQSWYYYGVLMYQNGYFGAANEYFEKAKQAPVTDPQRATKIAIYQAVCWVHLDRRKDAEVLMNSLAKDPEAQKDPDLLLVYAQLLYEADRLEPALQRVDQAIAARPDLVMGYFWKGKVLYRLGRLSEAAGAEEQAVRMLPQLAGPHGLLLKIYEAQGRTQDAAQQAEWLRTNEERQGPAPAH